MCELERERPKGHVLHPRPDVRRQRAEPHDPEVVRGEGGAGGTDLDRSVAFFEGLHRLLEGRLTLPVHGWHRTVVVREALPVAVAPATAPPWVSDAVVAGGARLVEP